MLLCNLCDNEALITMFPVPKGKNTPAVVNISDLKPNLCIGCYFKIYAIIKMPEYKTEQTVEEWKKEFKILNNL